MDVGPAGTSISMTFMTKLQLPGLLLVLTALAGTAGRVDAQSDPSPWRFGVTLGGGATVGVVAEYWNDDFGVEARLGTLTFQDVSVRLVPKWRAGVWDGGEVVWRAGAQWWLAGPALQGDPVVFAVLHGVELARVTDGGHVIGLGYSLPLFGGTWGWREAFDDLREATEGPGETPEEATEDPGETPEEATEDPGLPSSWVVGATVSAVVNLLLGELTYRYRPGG